MKVKIFAIATFSITILAIVFNTIYLGKITEGFISDIEELDVKSDNAASDAQSIRADFMKSLAFISLTVSHDDLTNIEDGFAELVGYLAVNDTEAAEVTKNRLKCYFEHLKRLSGFNIDSII